MLPGAPVLLSSRVMSIFAISSRKYEITLYTPGQTEITWELLSRKPADIQAFAMIHYYLYLRLIWLKTPIDVIAILSQLSGALAWPILQWSGNYQAEVRLSHPWALPAGLLLGMRI